jgi:enoyl-CoA hydratase/carnithine racemase
VVTIHNPPVNALHPDVSDEIASAAALVQADTSVRSMVLTGTAKSFVAGGDIKYFTTLDRASAADMASRTQAMQNRLFNLRVPVIAAVNGHALGGGLELALACDIIIAEEQAVFGLPEVTLGVIPGAGGTQMLVDLLPRSTAKRLMFTGDRFTAVEAQAYGLIDQVAPLGGSVAAALDIARRINLAGPLAVEAAKRSANYGLRHSQDAGHRREIELFAELFDSNDSFEGVNAFLERRSPVFGRD